MNILTTNNDLIIEIGNGIPGGFIIGGIVITIGIIAIIATAITFSVWGELNYLTKRSVSTFISLLIISVAIITTGGVFLGKQSSYEHNFENTVAEAINKKYDISIIDTSYLYSNIHHNGKAYFEYINEDRFYEEYIQIVTVKKDTDSGTEYTLNFFSVDDTDENGYLVNGGKAESFKPCTAKTCKNGERGKNK